LAGFLESQKDGIAKLQTITPNYEIKNTSFFGSSTKGTVRSQKAQAVFFIKCPLI